MADLTPFQTVGPYLRLGLRAGLMPMTRRGSGIALVVTGRVLDGAGDGIPDAALEFWAPDFDAIGRALTDDQGRYAIETVRPEGYRHDGVAHAPHFAVRVLGRGILTQHLTRMYLDDEPNTDDPVLQLVPPARRHTLVARLTAPGTYHFDVVVQGPGETVFFDL